MDTVIRRATWIRPLIFGLLLGLGAGVWFAVAGYPFGPVLSSLIWIVVAPIAWMFVVLAALASSRRGSRARHIRSALLGSSAFLAPILVVPWLALPICKRVNESRIETAIAWCVELAPKIDAWYWEHNAYPVSLDGSPLVVDPPFYCRTQFEYRIERDEFGIEYFKLTFWSREDLLSQLSYGSLLRRWTHDSGASDGHVCRRA